MIDGQEQVEIGELVELDEELHGERTPVDPGDSFRSTWFFVAIAVSLVLHGGLLFALIGFAADSVTAIDESEQALAVQLVDRNPQLAAAEPAVAEEEPPVEDEPAVEEVDTPLEEEQSAVAQELISIEPEPAIEIAEEAAIEPEIEAAAPELETIAELDDGANEDSSSEQSQALPPEPLLPNLVTLRDTLDRVEAQNRATVYSRECNVLEEDNNHIDCESQRQRNYRASQREASYRALNPIRAPTRTQRSLRTIARESLALAGNLRAADIPDGLVDYLLDELEIGMEINTHTGGNRALQDQKRLSGTWDPVARVAERIMNDPIKNDMVRRNAERRVHVDDN